MRDRKIKKGLLRRPFPAPGKNLQHQLEQETGRVPGFTVSKSMDLLIHWEREVKKVCDRNSFHLITIGYSILFLAVTARWTLSEADP
jgi:hypothetical protein